MTESVLHAFKCVSQDPTVSRMFTTGETYPVHRTGYAAGSGWVMDDLRRERLIGSSCTFIVENNSGFWGPREDVRRAYFEPITGGIQ